MFLRIKEAATNNEMIINTDNISYINEKDKTMRINGVAGLIDLDNENINKIIKTIKEIDNIF